MLILLELMRYLLHKQIALDIDVAEPELHNDGRTGPDPNISERVGDRQGTGLCVIEFQKGRPFAAPFVAISTLSVYCRRPHLLIFALSFAINTSRLPLFLFSKVILIWL